MSRQTLRSFSDQQVLSRIETLTRRERSITLLVLLYLNEIERRRLHLKLGYSSMFDYCTLGLGYSASAASRRIRTARCVRRYPEIQDLLKSNEVNISTVAQVSRVLTAENKDTVLARILGKSQREVEAVVAEFEPRDTMPRDRVRTIVVRMPVPSAPVIDTAGAVAVVETPSNTVTAGGEVSLIATHDRNGCAPHAPAQTERQEKASREATSLRRRTVLQFSASDEFMTKLEKVRSLAWHRLPANASLEPVFELALDFVIEKNDPSRRQERRRARAKATSTTTTVADVQDVKKDEKGRKLRGRKKDGTTVTVARQIPAAVRDEVYVRDGARCSFVGRNGRRCASARALQIDHVKPVALGGAGTKENLRVLCAYHNRVEAERLLGTSYRRDGP